MLSTQLPLLNGALLGLLLLFAPTLLYAQNVEQKLKAAFLYRFAQFVDWPQQAVAKFDGQLVLCLLGNDSLDGALGEIEGKSLGERNIAIRYIVKPQQLAQCHVAYINQPRSAWEDVQHHAQLASVLTVSDSKGFAGTGGMIELVRADNRLNFIINLHAAKAAGLHISAQLLKLARQVYE